MKPQVFAQMLTVSARAFGIASLTALGAIVTMSQPSSAQTPTYTYFCGTSNDGVPTTFARTVTGRRIAVISWVSTIGGEYTPQRRCQEVSARFQNAYEEGVLNYITTGIKDGEQVVCASSRYGGSCRNGMLLFTLKEGQKASEVIQDLFEVSHQARGPLIQSGDGSPQVYIDINRVLRDETRVQKEN